MTVSTTKVKSPSMLAHVVLRTANFKTMVDYYKKFLGAEASYENEILSFLRYDEEHHRIAIIGLPGTPDKIKDSAGMDHVAFAFETLDDLALTYRQRKEHGIVPSICVNHGPTTSMYYTDPDGNRIETQVDNFDNAEAANEFMASEAFSINPVGTDFDPEDLIKRLERGESHLSIKKRIEIGPRDNW
jgi:catechol-2,3-dioxygenase